MKKRFKFTAVCLVIITIMTLAGCSKNGSLIDLSRFGDEKGFTYLGVPWGSSPEEVAAQAKVDFGEPEIFYRQADNSLDFYLYELENIPFEGKKWHGEWQFDADGGFWACSFMLNCSLIESEKLYRSLSSNLENLYGSPTEALSPMPLSEDETLMHQERRWENGSTMLGLVRMYDEDEERDQGSVGITLMNRKNSQ